MYAKSRAYKNQKRLKMNTKNTPPLFHLVAIGMVIISFFVTGCTSLQQTTAIASDDLYYTPNKPSEELVAQNTEDEYQDYQNYQDDRYLRLKVANRNRWSGIDDWGYWNDPRYNNSFYPSYMGWNSWYTGYYGSSWYSPFGASFTMGWGGYNPYSSFGYGFGFNDFGYGGLGFGYGGFDYGGFGYGGFGYGGWNPYYTGYWNPYGSYYQYGGIYGGGYGGGMSYNNYEKRVPVQPNRTNLNPYMKNTGQFKRVGDVRENSNASFNNSNSSPSVRPNSLSGYRNVNSNTANNNTGSPFARGNSNSNSANNNAGSPFARGNANSNTAAPSSSFGSLVKRAVISNNSARSSNSNDYSNRNNSNTNQNNTPFRTAPSSSPTYSAPSSSGNSSSGGSSSGGGFIGGGRTKSGGQ